MSRGAIDTANLEDFDRDLPDVVSLQKRILEHSPELISLAFPSDSDVPVAAVCFADCGQMLLEARYALLESYASGVYHRDMREPPNPFFAVFIERLFLDDIPLRLYAASEHLARAITMMLGIENTDLAKYRKSNKHTSLQTAVGKFLIAERPLLPLTGVIKGLTQSSDWMFTISYRNKWVHEQPPTISGTGISYKRQRRWAVAGNKRALVFGRGDQPEYTLPELRLKFSPALAQFTTVVEKCVDHYDELLAANGIENAAE